jgi:predicted acetyltransferase
VQDDLLPDNSGGYRLQLDRGAPTITRATDTAAKMTVGALAALYTGFACAEELALAGQLTADAETQSTLSAIFSGPAPITADFF